MLNLFQKTSLCIVQETNETSTEVWGIKEVLEKFQIQKVSQVIDYLGMMGDAVDNIPGLPGVGKKTAQKFIYLNMGLWKALCIS